MLFSNQFLVGAYVVAREKPGETVRSGDVLQRFEFDAETMWVFTALEDWRTRGWVSGKGTVSDEYGQPIRFTGAGLMQAETLLSISAYQPKIRLPAKIQRASGNIYLSDQPPPDGFGQDSDIFLQSEPEAPASDRIVRFDHNSTSYQDISRGIDEIADALRGSNYRGIEAEFGRITAGIEAAQALWKAAELKAIQIKVGVLMAVQDASELLIGTAKAVAAALLVDTIKSFIKSQTGIDLDHL